EQLHHSSVTCFFHTRITDFVASPGEEYIDKVELTHTESGHTEYLSVDDVIVNHGYERDMYLLDNSDVEVERKEDYSIASNAIILDRKSTRLNSSHVSISYAVFCLRKRNISIIARLANELIY